MAPKNLCGGEGMYRKQKWVMRNARKYFLPNFTFSSSSLHQLVAALLYFLLLSILPLACFSFLLFLFLYPPKKDLLLADAELEDPARLKSSSRGPSSLPRLPLRCPSLPIPWRIQFCLQALHSVVLWVSQRQCPTWILSAV